MKVGIIGGGFTALTAALELLKKGYEVTVFEKEPYWGGLSSSFEILPGISIERFYHHLFTNDTDILSLCQEIGVFQKLRFLDGKTSHLYEGKIYPLDDPAAVLRFSPLSFKERLRFGFVTLFLKLQDQGSLFENVTADHWLRKWYGDRPYQVVWRPLLQGKFALYYDKVVMTWFWARVKKRTPRLIYPEGGFQVLIDALTNRISNEGGKLLNGVQIEEVKQDNTGRWHLKFSSEGAATEVVDRIIFTASLKALEHMFPLLPEDYKKRLSSIKYLSAQILLLVLTERLSHHYWINIGDTSYPFLVIGEQSNLFGLDYYQGRSVVYLGNYLIEGDKRLAMSSDDLIDLYLPYLKRINPRFERFWIEKAVNFVGPYAQPVMDIGYKRRIPEFQTPAPNLYLATMAQVYPWDRGTNYAVKLAKDLVKQYF